MVDNQQMALLHRDLVEQEEHVEALVGQVGDLKTRLGSLTAVGQQEASIARYRWWAQVAVSAITYIAPLLVTAFLVALSRSQWGWRRLPAAAIMCVMISLPGTVVGLLLILGGQAKAKLEELLGTWPARMLGLGGLVGGGEENGGAQPGSWWRPWTLNWWGAPAAAPEEWHDLA